ncbi:hypothetical protein N184_32775 [Sinorhizobium sp. GL28]|uniref:Uncharacterized protein n=1 Tax=Cellulomonas carbonis T26 TaxID=947969 RepID=A0A0A0BKJ1_9CELL|nr:hypothetical protein N868_17290 [Cellulomonas carbonis T26]KSV85692.1 hypothetical protein N184_32775 [Sinorhizobium sp. GL28]
MELHSVDLLQMVTYLDYVLKYMTSIQYQLTVEVVEITIRLQLMPMQSLAILRTYWYLIQTSYHWLNLEMYCMFK